MRQVMSEQERRIFSSLGRPAQTQVKPVVPKGMGKPRVESHERMRRRGTEPGVKVGDL